MWGIVWGKYICQRRENQEQKVSLQTSGLIGFWAGFAEWNIERYVKEFSSFDSNMFTVFLHWFCTVGSSWIAFFWQNPPTGDQSTSLQEYLAIEGHHKTRLLPSALWRVLVIISKVVIIIKPFGKELSFTWAPKNKPNRTLQVSHISSQCQMTFQTFHSMV